MTFTFTINYLDRQATRFPSRNIARVRLYTGFFYGIIWPCLQAAGHTALITTAEVWHETVLPTVPVVDM